MKTEQTNTPDPQLRQQFGTKSKRFDEACTNNDAAIAARQAGNDRLANFYLERFPPDLRKAYDTVGAEAF